MGYWSQERYTSWVPYDIPSPFPYNRGDGPDLQRVLQNLYSLKLKLRSIDDVGLIPMDTRNYLRWAFKAICSCALNKNLPNPMIRESLDVAFSDILDNIIPQIELGNPAPFIPLRENILELLLDHRDIGTICQELQSDLEEYIQFTFEFSYGMGRLAIVLFTQYPNSK
ncbi:13133_t:CDS:1 [Cetraspora pellucida]|uniref:13133_t:CDS:1 n=1 Tax=Cetraspora pellucida TaxID=1433469 RepID=A0A9N9GSE7_9GLOM|nr:13133_t:CDS:1 [Cetraspora pellucida]